VKGIPKYVRGTAKAVPKIVDSRDVERDQRAIRHLGAWDSHAAYSLSYSHDSSAQVFLISARE
jgi:hypothetical protein